MKTTIFTRAQMVALQNYYSPKKLKRMKPAILQAVADVLIAHAISDADKEFNAFKKHIFETVNNVKSSSYDYTISLTLSDQKTRQQALRNISEGKQTKAAVSLLDDIQEMWDDGYVYLNRGSGSHTERIQIPLKDYMDQINEYDSQ
jgi:hypothetical protein